MYVAYFYYSRRGEDNVVGARARVCISDSQVSLYEALRMANVPPVTLAHKGE